MTDESIINLSDETKSSLRIYATMAGFFILFGMMLYVAVSFITGQQESMLTVNLFGSALLLVIGVMLALLHKRDLFAAFFILIALINLLHCVIITSATNIPVAVILVIAALAFSQTRNEQRYIVAGLLFLNALSLLSAALGAFDVSNVLLIIYAIACLYFAFALACEKFKLPLRDYLTADEETPENDGAPVHFKEMGSSIGYLMLALFMLMEIYRFIEGDPVEHEVFKNVLTASGIILILTGTITMVAGRMKGTPFYFVCIGFIFLTMSAGASFIHTAFFVALGIMVMLRKDSRILLGLVLILMGVSGPLSLMPADVSFVFCAIKAIAFIISAYLVFAVNSNGKLKLI